MNTLKVTITDIKSSGKLHLVSFQRAHLELTMMSLELNEQLTIGTEVKVGTKATNVTLSKTFREDISTANQLQGTIISLEKGALLCSVHINLAEEIWESIITLDMLQKMHLKERESIYVLLNASELSIIGAL